MTIADSVSEPARNRPRHPALIRGGQVVAYAELDGLVRRTATHLAALGARPGDRIGLCLPDSIDHVATMLAVMRMSAIIVPMDWRAKQAEKSALATRFDLGLIVAAPGRGPQQSSNVVELDDAWEDAVHDVPMAADAAVGADDPMIINLSSGTTAAAKGAIVSHRQYAARLRNYRANFGALADRRYLSVLPLCFSGGRNYVLAHLQAGGTAVLHGSMFGPNEFPDLVARYDISATFVAP